MKNVIDKVLEYAAKKYCNIFEKEIPTTELGIIGTRPYIDKTAFYVETVNASRYGNTMIKVYVDADDRIDNCDVYYRK